MDVPAEFKAHCGPSVLFVEWRKDGRAILFKYTIPGLDPGHVYKIYGYVRNGLDLSLRREVIRCANAARTHAYRRTGHRTADIQRLLQGKLLP